MKPFLNLWRPFSISAGAIALFVIWIWLDGSCLDYRVGAWLGGRTTAGWFLLGSPFLFIFSFIGALVPTLLARKTRPVIAWILLLALFVPLIVRAWVNTTPMARLKLSLEIDPPADLKIDRLQMYDSFNDGNTVYAVCTADQAFVDRLIARHRLTLQTDDPSESNYARSFDEALPTDLKWYQGQHLTVYFSEERSRIYFIRRLYERLN